MRQYQEVTTFHTSEMAPYMERSEKQLLHWNEPKLGYFVAESPNVILRALEAGYEPVSFLIEKGQEGLAVNSFVESYPDTPVYVAEKALLQTMIGYDLVRGALCLMRRKKLSTVSELIEPMERIVVLEDVVNPTNLGAIFRSAAALGMDAVLLTKGCTDPLYRRAVRVSMGTVFQIPWTFLEGDDWLAQLQQKGYQSVAMALREDSISLEDPRLLEIPKLAVLMGTEGEGLRDETIEHSDYVVRIPMAHQVDSLNVAAASAVTFWQLGRK